MNPNSNLPEGLARDPAEDVYTCPICDGTEQTCECWYEEDDDDDA